MQRCSLQHGLVTLKPPKHLPKESWLNKVWHVQSVEFQAVILDDELDPCELMGREVPILEYKHMRAGFACASCCLPNA